MQQISKTMEIVYNITQTSNLQDEQIQKVHKLVYHMRTLIDNSLLKLNTAVKHSSENFTKASQIISHTEEKKFANSM